jgi:hypothetical protein
MEDNGVAPATETRPTFRARLRKRALCGKIGLAASLVAWVCLLAIVVVPHG